MEQIFRIDRNDTEDQFLPGIASGMLGGHASAEQVFRQRLKLNPNLPDEINSLGLSLDAQGRAEEAIKYFKRADQLAPSSPGFRFNYANALESLGELKQARKYYQQTLALVVNSPDAWCNLGNVLQVEGDVSQIVALNSADAGAYLALGNAYLQRGEL